MPMNLPVIVLSKHAVERLIERYPRYMEEKNLTYRDYKAKKSTCPIWLNAFKPLLEESTVNKSLFNNTSYMMYLYERYGYERRYMFLDYEGMRIRFVLIEENGVHVLVTLLKMDVSNVRSHIKYKVKKQEVKEVAPIKVTTIEDVLIEKSWNIEELKRMLRQSIGKDAVLIENNKYGPTYIVDYKGVKISFFYPCVPDDFKTFTGCKNESKRGYRLKNMHIISIGSVIS